MSLIEAFYVAVGLAAIAAVLACNVHLFGKAGPGFSGAEAVYHAVGLAALLVGWYFNFGYFRQYGAEAGWWHWCTLLFVNPASSSGAQDLIIANVLLFPAWTVLEARRSGMRVGWLYFPVSLVTSYAFALALFLAVQDRQRRFARPG